MICFEGIEPGAWKSDTFEGIAPSSDTFEGIAPSGDTFHFSLVQFSSLSTPENINREIHDAIKTSGLIVFSSDFSFKP